MSSGVQRVGLVGASSLAGKELAELLGDAALGISDVVLLDGEDATGQVTTAGNEIAVVQALKAEAFEGMDFVFFCGARRADQDLLAGGASGGGEYRRSDGNANGGEGRVGDVPLG